MANGPRGPRASRPQRPQSSSVGEKRIPDSYIVILQPTVTPYEMLSSVLKGYKPTFTYGSIFTGFAVDRVPLKKADEVREIPMPSGLLALSGRVNPGAFSRTLALPSPRESCRTSISLCATIVTTFLFVFAFPFLRLILCLARTTSIHTFVLV